MDQPPSGSAVQILIVEDNAADVYLVKEALDGEGLNYQLHVAGNGEQALQFIREADEEKAAFIPAIVLLDLNLPRADGEEVLRGIRASRRCSGIPVVVLTSSDSPRDRATVERWGASYYFRKPSDFDEFLKLGGVVRKFLPE